MFYLTGLIFPKQLVSLFSHEKGEFLNITVKGIRIYFLAFLVMGVNILLTSYLQSKNKEKEGLIFLVKRS